VRATAYEGAAVLCVGIRRAADGPAVRRAQLELRRAYPAASHDVIAKLTSETVYSETDAVARALRDTAQWYEDLALVRLLVCEDAAEQTLLQRWLRATGGSTAASGSVDASGSHTGGAVIGVLPAPPTGWARLEQIDPERARVTRYDAHGAPTGACDDQHVVLPLGSVWVAANVGGRLYLMDWLRPAYGTRYLLAYEGRLTSARALSVSLPIVSAHGPGTRLALPDVDAV
jgi:hypothetical protein